MARNLILTTHSVAIRTGQGSLVSSLLSNTCINIHIDICVRGSVWTCIQFCFCFLFWPLILLSVVVVRLCPPKISS